MLKLNVTLLILKGTYFSHASASKLMRALNIDAAKFSEHSEVR